MSQRTKGKCKYCGKEYTFSYMSKHMSTCEERQRILECERGNKKCGYFQLAIYSNDKEYWMLIEMQENAILADLDSFLRDIWLECCGHLSAFNIHGINYDIMPGEDFFWGEPAKDMNYKLKAVLEKGMTFGYEYDFGSTTELKITVVDYRIGYYKKDKLTILSRNNPPVLICDECGKKTATFICTECLWEGGGLLCEDCAETHECGEDMLLDVCNSPRMGVCGYTGSKKYPDQFMSDVENVK